MVGPVVKIDPADLPRRPNLHYLGGKDYEELPAYLGGWDVALMPFAINEFDHVHLADQDPGISRRRQAGRVDPDHRRDPPLWRPRGVFIADGAEAFVEGCEQALALARGGDDGWPRSTSSSPI